MKQVYWLLLIFICVLFLWSPYILHLATTGFVGAVEVELTASTTDSTAYTSQRKIERASDGNIHIVYHDMADYGYHKNSSDNGTTWSTRHNISSDIADLCKRSSLAITSGDDLFVVCEAGNTTSSIDDGVTWTVANSYAFGNAPDLAIDTNNNIHAANVNDTTLRINYRWSPSSPLSWPQEVEISTGQASNVDIAVDRQDQYVCMAYDQVGVLPGNIQVKCCDNSSNDCMQGGNWSIGGALSTATHAMEVNDNPSCAFDENQQFLCVWDNSTSLFSNSYNPIADSADTQVVVSTDGTQGTLSVESSFDIYTVFKNGTASPPADVLQGLMFSNRTGDPSSPVFQPWSTPYLIVSDISGNLTWPNAPSRFDRGEYYEWVYTNSTFNETWYYSGDTGGYCGGNYSGTGNWTIANTHVVYCQNEAITLDGNLSIENGGRLILSNITLRVGSSSDGEFGIEAKNGGRFEIWNNSVINATDTSFEYLINISAGASFEMNDSWIEECGWAADQYYGLSIAASYANITNSNISNSYVGVFLGVSDHTRIINNTIYDTATAASAVRTSGVSTDSMIINNTIYNSGDGILLATDSSRTNVSGNIIHSNSQTGIHTISSTSNNITNNTFYNNTQGGIQIVVSTNNRVDWNIAYNNTEHGIYLTTSSDNNDIFNNTAYNNTKHGIWISAGDNIEIVDNMAYNNTKGGVTATGSDSLTIRNNTLSENNENGIYIFGSDDAIIENNTVYENGQYGIFLESSCDNADLFNNVIENNTQYGFYIQDSTNNEISQNNITNNSRDIYADGAHGTTIHSNNISNSSSELVRIEASENITITNNSLYNSSHQGIALYNVNHTTISGNTAINLTRISLRFQDVNNGTVSNNTVNNVSYSPVYTQTSENITIIDNYLYNLDGHGINSQRSNRITISNNTVANSSGLRGPYRSGIRLSNTSNSTVTNNYVFNFTTIGILLNASGNIWGDSVVYNNTIQDNRIDNSTFGILVKNTTTYTNAFIRNNISNSSYSGILLNISTAIVLDNNIIDNNSIALHLMNHDTFDSSTLTNYFNNNTFNVSNNVTIAFNNSNMTWQDIATNTIPNATNWNITLSDNSQITFLNVTFNNESVNVSDTAILAVKWYLGVNVIDSSANLIEDATVVSVNSRNTTEFQTLTQSNGWIPQTSARAYEMNSTAYTYYNYYTVTASKTGYNSASNSQVTLTTNNNVYLTLTSTPSGGPGGGGGPSPGQPPLFIFKTKQIVLPCHVPRGGMETYEYIEVTDPPEPDDAPCIGDIRFEVEKAWLEEQGLNATDIVLTRFHDGIWSEIPTSILGEDEYYVKFKALSPTIDYFGIKGLKEDCRDVGCPEGQTCIQEENGEDEDVYVCVDTAGLCIRECPTGYTLDTETCACLCTRTCPPGQLLSAVCTCYEPEAVSAAGIDFMWIVLIGAAVVMMAAAYYAFKGEEI